MTGLYVVSIEALPLSGSEAANSYRGAVINVYTKRASEAAALQIGSREIEDAGWRSTSVEEVAFVMRQDFVDSAQGTES